MRDYIHVTDLATAHVLAIKRLLEGKESLIVNLGTGTGTSVKEIVDATENVIGKRLNYNFAPRRSGDPAVVTDAITKVGYMCLFFASNSIHVPTLKLCHIIITEIEIKR